MYDHHSIEEWHRACKKSMERSHERRYTQSSKAVKWAWRVAAFVLSVVLWAVILWTAYVIYLLFTS